MLYQFLLNFVDTFSFLNVFKYLTFRTGLSFFTSLVIVLIIGGPFIQFFSKQKILNPIRDDGPEDHIVKKIGTPTMGGLIILSGLLVSVIFWADLSNINILFCMYIAITFGLLGAYDDFKKIKYSNSSGISSKFKIISQIIFAGISKAKKGEILINKSQIIKFIKKDLNNNDYLMIKASLATGFNDIVKDLKGLR